MTKDTECTLNITLPNGLIATIEVETELQPPAEGDGTRAVGHLYLPDTAYLHGELCFGDRLWLMSEPLCASWGSKCAKGRRRTSGTFIGATHAKAREKALDCVRSELRKLEEAIKVRIEAHKHVGD